ncbi:hypothetical protein [Huintestinicola sp.]|uniref:hypothetical protein n=1 Tax=Huintestinicola sp. TaxID=2981661 RepID=UPI003D7D7882
MISVYEGNVMQNLSEAQLEFLKLEFGLTEKEISKLSLDEWHKIREKCADIEIEETYLDELDESLTEDDDEFYDCVHCTERGEIAASIVDLKYKQLFV